jgi:hypothetical protein
LHAFRFDTFLSTILIRYIKPSAGPLHDSRSAFNGRQRRSFAYPSQSHKAAGQQIRSKRKQQVSAGIRFALSLLIITVIHFTVLALLLIQTILSSPDIYSLSFPIFSTESAHFQLLNWIFITVFGINIQQVYEFKRWNIIFG